jgi:hypothetical protein
MLFKHELSFAAPTIGQEYEWVFRKEPVDCTADSTVKLGPIYRSGWLLRRTAFGGSWYVWPPDLFAKHPDLINDRHFSWRFIGLTKDVKYAFATDVNPEVGYRASVYCGRAGLILETVAETPFKALFLIILVGESYDKKRDAPPYP